MHAMCNVLTLPCQLISAYSVANISLGMHVHVIGHACLATLQRNITLCEHIDTV